MPEFKVGDLIKLRDLQPEGEHITWTDNDYNPVRRDMVNNQVCEVIYAASLTPNEQWVRVWIPTINRMIDLYSYLFKYYNEP